MQIKTEEDNYVQIVLKNVTIDFMRLYAEHCEIVRGHTKSAFGPQRSSEHLVGY